jgi:hypothetical protein
LRLSEVDLCKIVHPNFREKLTHELLRTPL